MSFNINSLAQNSPKRKSHAQIYIEDLMEDFTCPICFDEFEKCHTTQCGHNYCEKCIKESLNRRHTCPLCTQPATQQELIKNLHLDSILSKLQKTRETYASKYVHQLMSQTMEENKQNASNAVTSPLSKIFTKYTSENLIQYENYYQSMLRDTNKTQLRLQNILILNISKVVKPIAILLQNRTISGKVLYEQQPGEQDIEHEGNINDNKINEEEYKTPSKSKHYKIIEHECQDLYHNIVNIPKSEYENDLQLLNDILHLRINSFLQFLKKYSNELLVNENNKNTNNSNGTLTTVESNLMIYLSQLKLNNQRFNKACELLFNSYEEYMKEYIPKPYLLPISITIRLRGRSQFWNVRVQNTDRVGIVIDIMMNRFKELGDVFYEFIDDGVQLGILRALVNRNPEQPLEIIENMEMCFSELDIKHGTQVHVLSKFLLESEREKPCFTYGYVKSDGKKCNYYRCKDCGFNWICQSCSVQCHKGHDLVSFMKDHVPSYACCYCVKKKKCKILNSKSKK